MLHITHTHKSPGPVCTHLDMGNKKQCFSLSNHIAIFYILTTLGRKFCCKFPPILRLLDRVYVWSVWAKLFDG